MRLLIINNLSSGIQDGMVYDFIRQVAAEDIEIVLRTTDGTVRAESLVDDASTFDAVAVAGGDGTITSVAYKLANTGIPLLPLPAGTGNLLASNLISPLEPHALAALLYDMRTLDFDLGKIRIGDKDFGFSIVAGCGYDATIMQSAQPAKKTLGPLAYFQSAFTNLRTPVADIYLKLDGKEIKSKGIGVIIVNLPRIQFDIPLTPHTNGRDGIFNLCILKVNGALELLPAFVERVIGRSEDKLDDNGSLEMFTARSIEVVTDPPLDIQFDGETPNLKSPFSIEMMQRSVRFIVSEEAYEAYADPA